MKKVMLIEDDRKITLALGVRLRSMGYEVNSAADAVYAMDETLRCQPDLILMDINLPGGDGFMVADRMRSCSSLASVPIVFITASKQRAMRVRAHNYGATAFLEKPFNAAQLAEAVDSCLYV